MRREKRIFAVFAGIVAAFFLLIFYRIYHIQILRHEELDRYSASSEVIRTIKGRRGTIYDRNGEVLAISEPRIDLAVDPNGVRDKRGIASLIANAADLDEEQVLRLLEKKSNFRYLKKDVSYEVVRRVNEMRQKTASRLRELDRRRGAEGENEEQRRRLQRFAADLDQIIFVDGFKRLYPQGKLLANVLGWVPGNTGKGEGGIEFSFDDYLSGGEIKVRRLAIPGSGEGMLEVEKEMDSARAADLYLTIDIAIQQIAEEELDKMVEKTKAKWGAMVVMDPTTGRILAMANAPGFFPEEYHRYPLDRRRNFAVSEMFEPGSTIKIFSILAAMNENVVRPGERFSGYGGTIIYGKRPIRDHEPRGMMTVEEVVMYSSNIGTVQIADRLSSETLFRYLELFGFGKRTGIRLPGEAAVRIRPPDRWMPIDKANFAFGQGFAVNSVQLVRAVAAIFNGGVLWQPVIVDRAVVPSSGRVAYETLPFFTRVEFKNQSDKKMIAMLKKVVEEGTGRAGAIRGISVAGKTGTSQKYVKELKGYSKDDEVCSFTGAVPADDPKLVMVVVVDEPEGRAFGSAVAVPVFREVARRTLSLFGVYPARDAKEVAPIPVAIAEETTVALAAADGGEAPSAVELVAVPQVEGMPVNRAAYLLNQAGLNAVVSGKSSGTVRRQSPKAGAQVLDGTTALVETEEEKEEHGQSEEEE